MYHKWFNKLALLFNVDSKRIFKFFPFMTNNSAFEVHTLKSLLKRNLTNPNNYMMMDSVTCTHSTKLDVFNILAFLAKLSSLILKWFAPSLSQFVVYMYLQYIDTSISKAMQYKKEGKFQICRRIPKTIREKMKSLYA